MLQAIHLIDKGILKKSYLELFRDISYLIRKHYLHFGDGGTILPAHNHGAYFPKLFKDPLKYIVPQPEMRIVL